MRLRRSMMFVPGNNPGMIKDAGIFGADCIMFDLEDSVAMTEKDAARFLVYNALTTLDYGKTEIVVRINDLSSGLGVEDLEAIVRAQPDVIRLPKTENAQDVIDCEKEIERIEREAGIPVGTTGMMAAIETALDEADRVLGAMARADLRDRGRNIRCSDGEPGERALADHQAGRWDAHRRRLNARERLRVDCRQPSGQNQHANG